MTVMAIQVNLAWTHPSKDLEVMQQRIPEMQKRLFFDWAYEENGPRLRGEILVSLIAGEIINDMEGLLELGCCGNVVFAQSDNKKFPIVKCVLAHGRLTWWAQKHMQTPIRYDPIEGRKKK